MAHVAPRNSIGLSTARFALIAIAASGCAYLPRLTLGATSSLRARHDGAITASRWTVGAALGWRARADRREPLAPSSDAGAPRNASSNTPRCMVDALCRWELAARSEALLSADTLLQGAEP